VNDSRGHIEVNNDGSWAIFIRGKAGVNPFDMLAELINVNGEAYASLLEAAARLSSSARNGVRPERSRKQRRAP
jgi:hypothetical protein